MAPRSLIKTTSSAEKEITLTYAVVWRTSPQLGSMTQLCIVHILGAVTTFRSFTAA
jgi:hypothetical protein